MILRRFNDDQTPTFLIFACLINASFAMEASPSRIPNSLIDSVLGKAPSPDAIRSPANRRSKGETDFMFYVARTVIDSHKGLSPRGENLTPFKRVLGSVTAADHVARNAKGQTAIFCALRLDEVDITQNNPIISALIEAGFSVNARDKSGLTPLMAAVNGRDFETVDILHKNGAEVSAKDNYGLSAMHFAKTLKMIGYLRAKGLDINEQDYQGRTLLHILASRPNNKEIISALLRMGANKTLKDRRGYSPFDAPESFYTSVEETKEKKSKKRTQLTLTDRDPKLVPAYYIYVSINAHVGEAIDSLGFTPTDFVEVMEATRDLSQSIKRYAISKNAPDIAVDTFRISLLKIMYLKVGSTISDTFFHKDLTNYGKTQRWWKSFHGLVNEFRGEMNWNGVCPPEENIQNQAVQNLRNLIVPVQYLDDSYARETLGTRVTTERKPISPEDLNFYSALTDTSARLLSTGGAWGMNYRRVVRGIELKVMMDSAENIGEHVTFRYLKDLGRQQSHDGAASSEELESSLVVVKRRPAPAPAMRETDGRAVFELLSEPKKTGHKYKILQSLAQKLYTPEDTSNPNADKLTRHQTAAFFLASRKAIEKLKRETCWDDKDMDATIIFANKQLAATGRTLKVDRAYMDDLLGKIYDRLGS